MAIQSKLKQIFDSEIESKVASKGMNAHQVFASKRPDSAESEAKPLRLADKVIVGE